jgi:hypothetical protein
MNPVSPRTRSQNEEQVTTIRLRSSIRGLEGLIISIPRFDEDENDDSSDFTYVETETTEESDEDATERGRTINFEKLNKFVVNKSNKPCDDCPICLDEFKCRQHCRKFRCSHIFHKKCIDRWLAKNVHCPVCRSSVQSLQPTTRNIRILRSRRVV